MQVTKRDLSNECIFASHEIMAVSNGVKRLGDCPELLLPYTITLIACNPEEHPVLLVNQLAASASFPQKGFAMRYPLAIHIDSLRLSMLIYLRRMCCIVLHQLKYIFIRFEFT